MTFYAKTAAYTSAVFLTRSLNVVQTHSVDKNSSGLISRACRHSKVRRVNSNIDCKSPRTIRLKSPKQHVKMAVYNRFSGQTLTHNHSNVLKFLKEYAEKRIISVICGKEQPSDLK